MPGAEFLSTLHTRDGNRGLHTCTVLYYQNHERLLLHTASLRIFYAPLHSVVTT
jgi:hypothetical protein